MIRSKIKYLVMDVDGSLTDGKIYIGSSGELMKAFSARDGYAVNHILPDNGIKPVVITGRKSDIVARRCEELHITEVHQEVTDKLSELLRITDDLSSVAYFGDDIPDLKCMLRIREAGGIVGCPVDAVTEVVKSCNYVCNKCGGDGALREFVEWMINLRHSE